MASTETTIHENTLDSRLAELEEARSWSPRAVAKLENFIRSATDRELYRVNPYRYAESKGITPEEAIDLLLHASKVGLFEIDWALICPMCAAVVKSFRILKHIDNTYYCTLCERTQETSLDDYVEVSFTVSPLIRPIPHHRPEEMSARQFYTEVAFSPLRMATMGMSFIEMIGEFVTCAEFVPPGATVRIPQDYKPGHVKGYDHFMQSAWTVHVEGEPSTETQTIDIPVSDGAMQMPVTTLRPGPVEFVVRNLDTKMASLATLWVPPEFSPSEAVNSFEPFLTAKQLLTRQTFRRLFGGELSVGENHLKVRDLALLFTDLKGSTALYERIGDLHAFSLVQQHFESIERIVADFNGTIVKTIGDAVMAAFSKTSDAAAAAVKMRDEIEGLNSTRGSRDVVLKIGLHKGSAIAVMLNERLDYFGQTVNIAARVQGVAESDEIAISDDAMREPGVAESVARFSVSKAEANLKGVADALLVHHVGLTPA